MLQPDEIKTNIAEIELDSLKSLGVKLVLVDIDNTLIPRGDESAPQATLDWMQKTQQNFKLALISNNSSKRFPELENFSDYYQHFSCKPLPHTFKKLMKKFNAKPSETVIIGDQIFTDILGGNFLNLHTILVRRLRNYGKFTRKLLHKIEDKIIERYANEAQTHHNS